MNEITKLANTYPNATLVILGLIVLAFGIKFLMSIFKRRVRSMITTAIGTAMTGAIMTYVSHWVK